MVARSFCLGVQERRQGLSAAYQQLLQYRESLGNPPLLVVCDLKSFQVHTNFDRTQKRIYSFSLDDLQKNVVSVTCPLPPLEVLRALFFDCDSLRPERTAARLTEDAARLFSHLAESIELDGADPRRGMDRHRVAHFLMKLLFCLFADSIGLFPGRLFRVMIEQDRHRPEIFERKLRALFRAMAVPGSDFGPHNIHWFNGGLFVDGEPDEGVLKLNTPDMGDLYDAAQLDWATIEPAIFGTLFERSLNAIKRSQIGAHYTSTADILLVVEPVVVAPLRAEWQAIRAEIEAISAQAENAKGVAYNQLRQKMQTRLHGWLEKLATIRVLDPACGSGNFLYLALRKLLDLWREAYEFAVEHGLAVFQARAVNPAQMFGIEIDFYAHELASIVVWIGYLQWLKEHGMGWPDEPILRKLDNIRQGDAILQLDAAGKPKLDADGKASEPEWPEANYIVSNPPFLGDKRMRAELGDSYVDALRQLYEGRVPGGADLVTYWFEKAREMVEAGEVKRVGLLATQGIRGGANRTVLERILDTGSIFMAWSDRDWVLDGANVHVSIVCFDNGSADQKVLNDVAVANINCDLSTGVADLTTARPLPENNAIAFIGNQKGGKFDIEPVEAQRLLAAVGNPNGRPNSDVIKPWLNASDVTGRNRKMWIIDFGVQLGENDAALYQWPFEYVREHVRPGRIALTERDSSNENWWRHQRPRPEMRAALEGKQRYIVTPRHSKHRIFDWVSAEIVPDSALVVFARDDDYFFGVLHSRVHEAWARATGTQVREVESGFRYTPTCLFRDLSRSPGRRARSRKTRRWSRPSPRPRANWCGSATTGSIRPTPRRKTLAKLTLTNLYNKRPKWLENAHRTLDEAVFAAYGWPATLTDAELLERLLALNHERAAS